MEFIFIVSTQPYVPMKIPYQSGFNEKKTHTSSLGLGPSELKAFVGTCRKMNCNSETK